jgi:hypothetical protein
MTFDESLHDVTIRERQLEAHILSSSEYLYRADQELKRQVSMLYLAIALLFVFQGLFAYGTSGHIPMSETLLTTGTSFLAIANCLLLIRTKMWKNRLNEKWLNPHEKTAIDALRGQRNEIITKIPRSKNANGDASLN